MLDIPIDLNVCALLKSGEIVLDHGVSFFIVDDLLVQVLVDLVKRLRAQDFNHVVTHLCAHWFSDKSVFLALNRFKVFRSKTCRRLVSEVPSYRSSGSLREFVRKLREIFRVFLKLSVDCHTLIKSCFNLCRSRLRTEPVKNMSCTIFFVSFCFVILFHVIISNSNFLKFILEIFGNLSVIKNIFLAGDDCRVFIKCGFLCFLNSEFSLDKILKRNFFGNFSLTNELQILKVVIFKLFFSN